MTATRSSTRAEETRARILSAAVDTFSAKGFHGTTTRDIARAAGISPTALYVHHESKEELLYVISRMGHVEALRVVQSARATSADPVEQLRAVVHDFVIHHARAHKSSRVVNYELAALSEDHLHEIKAFRRQIEGEIRELVDIGADAEVFVAPNRRMAANALISLALDIPRWYRDDGLPPEEIAVAYADMAVRSIAAR